LEGGRGGRKKGKGFARKILREKGGLRERKVN
jgi:hypothetical protein